MQPLAAGALRPTTPSAIGPRRPGGLVYSSWFGDLGGGELRMLDHLRATALAPGRITVLVAQSGPLQAALATLGAATRLNVWKGGSSWWTRQWHWYRAWLRCAWVLRTARPRLVVCNTFFDLESTGQVAGALGLPLVWRARADTFPYAHHWPAGRLATVVGFLNRRVAAIAATTNHEAEMMIAAGVDRAKVRVIRNGVDLARYEAAAAGAAMRAEQGFGADDFVLGFVARMVPQKGYAVFFDAMAALKARGVPVRALVAGDTTLLEESADAYKRSLREQVLRLGLVDDVRFLGFRNDVPVVMNAIDAFVCASAVEPFGNTIIEAMAAARPVVSSDVAGPRESIVEGCTGAFFAPGDAAALADRLQALHLDRAAAAAMGREGRRRAEQVFDLGRNIAELDRLCSDVAAR